MREKILQKKKCISIQYAEKEMMIEIQSERLNIKASRNLLEQARRC